jgi:hypothetical protein
MAALIVDEPASIELHRFLSFLRLLMNNHPRVGANRYAVYLDLATPLVTGWNAVHTATGAEVPVKYIFISPDAGLTTEKHPDVPDDQIHVVLEEDLPPFEGSAAWHQVIQLADVLRKQRPTRLRPDWVQEWLDLLTALAAKPLRGEDQSVPDRVARIRSGIRDAVNGPAGSIGSFMDPLEEVVEDFLDFRLTRRQAANILAVLFATFAIEIPSPHDSTGGAEPVKEQIDHLISLVSTITRDRHKYNLGSYEQLTYLGLLWAETTILMANQLAKQSNGTLPHWFEQRSLYVEEKAAHDLEPSLMHPISFAPFGVVEYLRAQNQGFAKAPRGLYAGAGHLGAGPLAPDEVWPRIQAYSATAKRLRINYGGYKKFLSKALAEHLSLFLLAMKLGQGLG